LHLLPSRRQEALAAQHRSNQQQLARKAAAAQADRAADAAFKEAWTQRLAALKQEELQEAADARGKALQVGCAGCRCCSARLRCKQCFRH
jgi:hypothetical protein